jgi:Carboxypeptidase regulatory-like domain/TonB dependent receptor-like, beta-barrel
VKTCVAVTCGFLCACALFWGQAVSTSQINGTVHDPTGAAVAGAEVKATQTATGAERTTTSGSDGGYVLTNLPVGPYQLEVSKAGFTKYVRSGIVLQVASNPSIDVTLQVGAVTQQVVVQADATMVETHSTGVGQVVDEKRVVDLPLNGRQATDLVFLSGAAVIGVNGDTQTSGKNYPVSTISVGGGRSDGITFLLDGGTHNDPSNSENLPLPFPDALQEFKVETNALPAQYGQHSAAAVNAVSKSGSNAFHGDLFEFIRNGDLNARNFFAPQRDMLKRNQFGGTIGGPIKKNKLFFFTGYQGTIQRSTPINSIVTIPTPAMMQGNFTDFASAACNGGVAKTLRGGFVNNMLPASLFSTPAVNLLKLYPTTSDPCGKYSFGALNNVDEHQGIARVDYQLSDKQSLFFRYYVTHLLEPVASADGNILLSAATGTEAQDQSLVFGDTYLISSNTVSSFRMTGIRTMVSKVTPNAITANDIGVQNLYSLPGTHQTSISFAGGLPGIGTVIFNGSFPTVGYQFNEDLSMIHGSHQFGFGANYIRTMMNDYSTRFANGYFLFTGATTGVPYGDLLAGKVGTFQQGSTSVFQPRANYVGLYAQDSWKVTPRLAVNYGIRWEPTLPTPTEGGRLSVFQQDWFLAGVHSTRFPNAPAGVLFPGDKEPNGSTVPDGISSANWKNFAPRVGLVWDPKGDGRMTIRAAYGIFYDLPNIFWNNNVGYEAPWSGLVQLSGVNFANPYGSAGITNPFPFVFTNNSQFPAFSQYWNGTLTRHPNYMNQWNLSIQKQLGSDWLLTANYLGSEAVHVWNTVDLNPAQVIPGLPFSSSCAATATNVNCPSNTNQRRQLILADPTQGAYYSTINSLYDGGTESYNALLLSVQKRLSKGFLLQANYTYSHCIGENQVYEITSANITNPNNLQYDRGNCNTLDRRQIFNLSAVGETPRFSDRTLRLIASGWRLSPIITAQTGNFVNATTGTDTALNGQPTTLPRPNLIAGSPYPSNQTVQQWINPAAFAVPSLGTYGNLGSGAILAPGSLTVNVALSRLFTIREGQTLEVRAEAFNFINRANFAPPTLAENNATFGQITQTLGASITGATGTAAAIGDPRILQFALKYYF